MSEREERRKGERRTRDDNAAWFRREVAEATKGSTVPRYRDTDRRAPRADEGESVRAGARSLEISLVREGFEAGFFAGQKADPTGPLTQRMVDAAVRAWSNPEPVAGSPEAVEALQALVRVMTHIVALRAVWPDRAPPGIEPTCWQALCVDADAAHELICRPRARLAPSGEPAERPAQPKCIECGAPHSGNATHPTIHDSEEVAFMDQGVEDVDWCGQGQPTHWMPLPAPPVGTPGRDET